jgi:hypothetical protein
MAQIMGRAHSVNLVASSLANVGRDCLTAGEVVDHDIDFARRQPVNGESRDMRLADPMRLKLRPERHEYREAVRALEGRWGVASAPSGNFQALGLVCRQSISDLGSAI